MRDFSDLFPYKKCKKGLFNCTGLVKLMLMLIIMLILCTYDACYRSFMNFLHLYAILLKFIFVHNLGLIMYFNDC